MINLIMKSIGYGFLVLCQLLGIVTLIILPYILSLDFNNLWLMLIYFLYIPIIEGYNFWKTHEHEYD